MRRDVKIGIAVGLGVVAVAVLYFVFTGGEGSDTEPSDVGDRQDSNERNVVRTTDPPRDDIIRTTARDGLRRDDTKLRIYPRPDPSDRNGTATTRPSTSDRSSTPPPSVVTTYTPPRLTPLEASASDPTGSRTPPAIRDTSVAPTHSVTVDRQRTDRPSIYVVKEGDDGFWAVSQNVYGHGKHWQLIRDANPDVDSNALRAGQRLRVPALPEEHRSPLAREESTPGSVRALSGGRRIYTVQEGDLGFWGISQKVYGTGKYGHLIARENPQADSNALRPGQKLIIPPKPVEADTPEAARREDSTVPPGGSTYTVQEGDKGFWGVAQKVYGDGTLWPLIQKANPGVDSGSLKPGQTLAIPPRDETRPARTSSTDTERRQENARRPVFD